MEQDKFSKGQLVFIHDMQKVLRRYGQNPKDWYFDYIPASRKVATKTADEPDYKAVWENLRASLQQWRHAPDDHCIPNVLGEMADIEAMANIKSLHTPQGDQSCPEEQT